MAISVRKISRLIPQISGTVLCLLMLLGHSGCTNYSSSEQTLNPPILLEITAEGSGHLIRMAAQNTEPGFISYKLYEGATENEALASDPLGGFSCNGLNVIPNQPVDYYIEVKPDQTSVTPGTTNRLCVITHSLTSGTYVVIRPLMGFLTGTNAGISSNALRVP